MSSQKFSQRQERYQDWKFGIFIHWGISAGFGDQGNKSRAERLDIQTIVERANRFEEITTDFNPREWIRTFKNAGARYFVMTSKHSADVHFCLFKTKHRNFKSTRDYIGEIANACKAEDFPLILYLSIENEGNVPWMDEGAPDPASHFERCTQLVSDTIVEFVEQYNPAGIWFDGWPGITKKLASLGIDILDYYDMDEVCAPARHVNPDLLVGNKAVTCNTVDFLESELMFTDQFGRPLFGDQYPTEVDETLPGSFRWFCSYEKQTDFMTPEEESRQTDLFIKRMICCAGRGINYLLDTGPLPSGELLESDARILGGIGSWLETYGEAVYGTRMADIEQTDWGYVTVKNGSLYLLILDNRNINDAVTLHSRHPIPESGVKTGMPNGGIVTASGVGNRIVRAQTMKDGNSVPFTQNGDTVVLDLSATGADPVCTVVKMETDSEQAGSAL